MKSAVEPADSKLPQLTSVDELPNLDLVPRLGSYQARDAAWARGQPIVVNRDYDFQLAMSLHYRVGPALAASKRKEANLELARRIEQLPRITPSELLEAVVRHCAGACSKLRRDQASLYSVVYGAEQARLSVVLELADTRGESTRVVAIGSQHRAEQFADFAVLRTELDSGVSRIGTLLGVSLSPDVERVSDRAEVLGRCRVGGTESLGGRLISRAEGYVIMQIGDSALATQAACPSDAFSASAAGTAQPLATVAPGAP